MTRAPDRLHALLPALDVRLREPEIRALAARLPGEPGALSAGLIGFLGEAEEEIAAWEADLATTTAAVETGDGSAIATWLRRRSVPDRLRGDLRAVRRHLDLSVVRERTVRAVERLGILQELALRALGGLPAESSGAVAAASWLRRARRWQTRLAAIETLVRWREQAGPSAEQVQAAVLAAGSAPGEHPWVRAACDEWQILDGSTTGFPLGLVPLDEPRHFLLRRLRVRVALRRHAREEALRLLDPVVDDPSEHVRIGLAADLGATGDPAVLLLLARLAQAVSPRVRLAAVVAIRRNLPALAAPESVRLLAGVLATAGPPHLHVEAIRAMEDLAVHSPRFSHRVRDALVAPSGAPLVVLEAVAAAVRDVDGADRLAWFQARRWLVGVTRSIPPGQGAFLSWADAPDGARIPDDALGAHLAAIAAEDFGLYARPDAVGVHLWRGDRERFRAWRFVYELLRPAPNKRGDHPHVVGRHHPGPFRAPPGGLAEVTATSVPGERVAVDRDGTWARHLPAMDDLLDLGPRRTIKIFSAFGHTEVVGPTSWLRYAWNRLRLVVQAPELARLRLRSLRSAEPSERAAFVDTVRSRYDIDIRLPPGALFLGVGGLEGIGQWLKAAAAYLASPSATSQSALALFAAGALGVLLADGWGKRRAVRQARAAIPLCIGGWGTRGKSGTERLKAALFHGLGHPVVVKTTGCEAMFISASPGQAAREIFIYRPYDKSTIWEQARLVRLAAGLGARVFTWECMALRSRYVEILEQDWMRDDLCTITNAYPDHEDVQGPTGMDVARTITSFIPERSVAITTEVEYLPLFRERARERDTVLHAVPPVDAEMLGSDLLALFPYQEHPRNIALVARMATELGVDPDLAIVTMADHVVPDLGVLRTYPAARVESRVVTFINGMSANERTGCVANWRRTGCDAIPLVEADHVVVTVVNNRADRVARSEVFARILVEDLAADAHVLIGTNLRGLLGYIDVALDRHLANATVLLAEDAASRTRALARLETWMARLRIPVPSEAAFLDRVSAYARGAGCSFAPSASLGERVRGWLEPAPGAATDPNETRVAVEGDAPLRAALREALVGGLATPSEPPEAATAATVEEVLTHSIALCARLVTHVRLRARVTAAPIGEADAVNAAFRTAWAAIFRSTLRVVEDPLANGDRVILACARAVPPGTRVTLMGIQNIKGTGLDFAYRWVAQGEVHGLLARARAADRSTRVRALIELDAFDDHGLIDAMAAASGLATGSIEEDAEEAGLRDRARARAVAVHSARLASLGAARNRSRWGGVLDAVEGWFDWLDSARRAFTARRVERDLVLHHVSLAEAARQMQALTVRQKGGWLAKDLLPSTFPRITTGTDRA